MFGFLGALTSLVGKLPVLGPLIAKLWTDNSKVAEIEAETNLEETKAFGAWPHQPEVSTPLCCRGRLRSLCAVFSGAHDLA